MVRGGNRQQIRKNVQLLWRSCHQPEIETALSFILQKKKKFIFNTFHDTGLILDTLKTMAWNG